MRLIDADVLKANLPEPNSIKQDWVYRTLCDFIDNAPTVEERPQGEWISTSERLPSDNEPYEVLCCDIRGEIMIGHPFEDECSECGYSAESECYEMYECIAWQLLPKPYGKGGTE